MYSSTVAAIDSGPIWLRSKKWDLFWITGSAVLGAFPIIKKFYGFNPLLTLIAGVFICVVYKFSGFTIDQSYYTVVLSFLLLHYYFDHFLFFSKEDELKPAFSPARA
jgi:hypothetical protein